MKIGIYGGSFNPPHRVHHLIAKTLLEEHYVDRVIFVPAGDQYPKKGMAKALDRIQMLTYMIEEDEKMSLSDFELTQDLTYTYQTLSHFKEKYPNDDIYFICGADNLDDFKRWRTCVHILESYHLLVVGRSHLNIEDLIEEYAPFQDQIINTKLTFPSISSTEIRERLGSGKTDPKDFPELHPKVFTYLMEHKLYEEER